ncbi:MAG: OmpA family protein [Candidatus Porifericomitaceae bacterium WSBS_2022_MAG_OTU9]
MGGVVAGVIDDDENAGAIASGVAAGGIIGGIVCGAFDEEAPTPEKPHSKPKGLDSDNDGVLDEYDICPDTSLGLIVDGVGCPILKDSDGDGITDNNDLCPNTQAGSEVDYTGCPIVGERISTLENIHFAFNQAKLMPITKLVLDGLAESMKSLPGMRISVEGHTDDIGSQEYNLSLSRRRARSAVTYLVRQHGIDSGRFVVVAHGKQNPIAGNDTESGRSSNRRVELIVIER